MDRNSGFKVKESSQHNVYIVDAAKNGWPIEGVSIVLLATSKYAGPNMIELNPSQPAIWQTNAFLTGQSSNMIAGPFEGTLSFKAVDSGRISYQVNSRAFEVDPFSVLIVPELASYAFEISEPTRTTMMFFRPGFVEELSHSREQVVLDTSFRASRAIHFCSRLEPKDEVLRIQMNRLLQLKEWPVDLEAEVILMELANRMLAFSEQAQKEASRLTHVNASVREEIFTRLNIGRDFILSNITDRLRLEDIASAAMLSPVYFHFLFKEAFQMTPHTFVTSERVRRAKLYLSKGKMPLNELAGLVGFKSEAHLCRLLKKY